jgi:DNA-directed RNA polymerase specialized sigma24 family protein
MSSSEIYKTPDRLEGDQLLVSAALTADPAAWSALYARFHNRLLAAIRAILGRHDADSHLVEEIAARVWYALIKDDFALLSRFDVNRGCRFSTILSLLAKNETKMFFRSEQRRRNRERVSSKNVDYVTDFEYNIESDEEFLSTLTRAELTFYKDVLIGFAADNGEADYSPANVWQLTRRVKKKLQAFLGD